MSGAIDGLAMEAIQLSESLFERVERLPLGRVIGRVAVDGALSVGQLALKGGKRLRRLQCLVALSRVLGVESGTGVRARSGAPDSSSDA